MAPNDPPAGRLSLGLAAVFYGSCAALAFLWGALAGRPQVIFQEGASSWPSAGLGAAIGLGLGLAVVALSRLVEHRPWARDLYLWFAEILGPLSTSRALLLAALSSLGEELLFRGAMQPSLGLWPTTAIFALLHFPPQRQLWPWTVMAGALGAAFGAIAVRTGNLAGPVVAHLVVNFLNLRRVSQLARSARATEENLPGPASPS